MKSHTQARAPRPGKTVAFYKSSGSAGRGAAAGSCDLLPGGLVGRYGYTGRLTLPGAGSCAGPRVVSNHYPAETSTSPKDYAPAAPSLTRNAYLRILFHRVSEEDRCWSVTSFSGSLPSAASPTPSRAAGCGMVSLGALSQVRRLRKPSPPAWNSAREVGASDSIISAKMSPPKRPRAKPLPATFACLRKSAPKISPGTSPLS